MTDFRLTREQSRRVDRRAIDVWGIEGLVLMENAGRGVVDHMEDWGIEGPVVVCCGRGNNAGDGFVIARHLDLRGHEVCVQLWADPTKLAGDAAANYRILEKTDVTVVPCYQSPEDEAHTDYSGAAWIVEALLGTGARGEPRPPFDLLIDRMNQSGVPILAVDVPSGLDCDSGEATLHTVRATHTCTFVAPKVGFFEPAAAAYLGTVWTLAIGVPAKLIAEMLAE